MARLNGVQKAMANQPSSSLVLLENQLLKELEVILEQERDLWALKSRINWMILGDRNTSFYHVFTLARRKRNYISGIKNEVGEWLSEERIRRKGSGQPYKRRVFEALYYFPGGRNLGNKSQPTLANQAI